MGYSVLTLFAAHGVQSGAVTYETADRFEALLEGHKQAWIHHLSHLDGDTPLSFLSWDDWDEAGATRTPSAVARRQGALARPLREGTATS